MKTRKLAWIMLMVLPVSLFVMTTGAEPAKETGQAQPNVAPAKPKLSGTWEASCLLKITCDPATFPLVPEAISALVNSAGIKIAAAHEVLGEAAEPTRRLVTVLCSDFCRPFGA